MKTSLIVWLLLVALATLPHVRASCATRPDCSAAPNCWVRGTCVDELAPSCTCDPGWSGSDCSTSDCGCVHGACVNAACVCETGWTGAACDTFYGLAPLYLPTCNMDNVCRCGAAGALCTATPTGAVAVDLAIFSPSIISQYSTITTPRLDLHVRRVNVEACDCRVGSANTPASGERYQLALSVSVINIGTAALFIGAPDATYYGQDCLGRPLFESFVRIELLDSSSTVVRNHLIDYNVYDTAIYGNVRSKFTPSMQGMSVMAGTSLRGETNDGIWFDITDLIADTYTVRVTVNPASVIPESDYANNVATVAFDMTCPGCQNGVCDHGFCNCNAGFTGKLCDAPLQYVNTLDTNDICTGDCSGKFCGSDGCSGSCGSCDFGSCDAISGSCVADLSCSISACAYSLPAGMACAACVKPGESCSYDAVASAAAGATAFSCM